MKIREFGGCPSQHWRWPPFPWDDGVSMYQRRIVNTVAVLIATCLAVRCARGQQPAPRPISLARYLNRMGDDLDCYFTIEDRPARGTQAFPWIAYLKDFEPDFEVATIDALVAKLDQELDGVQVVRSTKFPSVVHLIAEDLLVQGYPMVEQVTVQYEGLLRGLPDRLGTVLDGKIGSKDFGTIQEARAGMAGDFRTETEIDVENALVRDILTGAVPLEGYKRFLWESGTFITDDSTVYVKYFGHALTAEDLIFNLEDYLVEMGKRLNCYFTIEDRPDPDPEAHELDPDFPYLIDRGDFEVDLDIATIDALVTHLDAQLDGVTVVRSTAYPSVVHLIAEDLVQEGYVMQEQVTLNYTGDLDSVPDELGMLLNGRIAIGRVGDPPYDAGEPHRDVEVAAQNDSVRNILTGAAFDDERLLWQSVRVEEQGSDKVFVKFYGSDMVE